MPPKTTSTSSAVSSSQKTPVKQPIKQNSASPSQPLPNDPNKYEKKDFIGEGSFGKVYKCIDKADGVID